MTDSPVRADYVFAKLGPDRWLYIGTMQAPKSSELAAEWSKAQSTPRPALLATNTSEPLYFGPQNNEGRIIYASDSKADFLCRLRLFENTDYHWEVFAAKKEAPEVIPETILPETKSSLIGANRVNVRWEADNRQARGQFNFGNFLGAGWIGLDQACKVRFEVISAKLGYEDEYLALLKDLTEQSLALLFDFEAPTSAQLALDADKEQKSSLEAFLLLQAALPLRDLRAAMGMIRARPHSQLESDDRWMPASMATGQHAMGDPIGRIRWATQPGTGKPVPVEALERKRRDTTDTPPNRFLKFALEHFRQLCLTIQSDPGQYGRRLVAAAGEIQGEIDQQLRSELVKSAGRQTRIPYENQVLQKREGYRQLLRTWIVSNSALSIRDTQNGGALSPRAENRQVPDLYEYWLFFFLAEALEGMAGAMSIERRYVKELNPDGQATIALSQKDSPRLVLKLGKGDSARYVALYYNRSFARGAGYTSYSLTLRPDYTIETFPVIYGSMFEACQNSAAKAGEITYIHFDAKFRIQNLDLSAAGDAQRDSEQAEDLTAKPEDVYKMHTYNEAIRGTAASVILFPGDRAPEGTLNQAFQKYRELIPGVGALAIRPGDGAARAVALKSARQFLSQALDLAPRGPSAYSQHRRWEVEEMRE